MELLNISWLTLYYDDKNKPSGKGSAYSLYQDYTITFDSSYSYLNVFSNGKHSLLASENNRYGID